MPVIRYTGGAVYNIREGPRFEDGDEAEVNEDTADRLTDRHDFELVEDTDDEGVDMDGVEPETLPFNPREYTNDEVADQVEKIDDPETVRALYNLEVDQRDRTGATDAIESRLDELED